MHDPSYEPQPKPITPTKKQDVSANAWQGVYAVSYLGRRHLFSTGKTKVKVFVMLYPWERIEFDIVNEN